MFNFIDKYKRIISQIFFSLILLFPFSNYKIRWICTPVMHCHGCAFSHFVCPVGILAKYPSEYLLFPFVLVGTLFLIGSLLGRALCGWACPIGFMQDLLYKIPTPKFNVPNWIGYGKYISLIALVLIAPMLTEYFFCNLFCVTAGVEITLPSLISGKSQIALAQLPGIDWFYIPAIVTPATETAAQIVRWDTTFRFTTTIILIIVAIFTSRIFCKILCPIGALMAIFNYFSFTNIKGPKKCISCKKCNKACPMDCEPMERLKEQKPANHCGECITCNKCNIECPMVAKEKKDLQKAKEQ